MSIFKSISQRLPDNAKAANPYLTPALTNTVLRTFGGEGMTLYPSETGATYINEGYKKSAIVHSIVSKCARKFAQVPWYHYRIKKNERKTWQEYVQLTKDGLHHKANVEAVKMRKKAIDQVIIDSQLTKRIANPNRNQTRAAYLEQLYMFKLLTGEGNTWFSRGLDDRGNPITKGKPLEMFAIPKGNLNLIKGSDAWDIKAFEINIQGEPHYTPRDNMNLWIFTNPVAEIDGSGLSHLRGMSPLQAGLLLLQADNVGAEKLINMNKNQGAAALATNETPGMEDLTPEQSLFIRQQFNNIVNNTDMAGKVAVMSGIWKIHQLGMNVGELKILEQKEVNSKWICNLYDFPPGLFDGNQTYDNKKEDKRNLVYDRIAPDAYSLRDDWNTTLMQAYDLDRETNVLDCDILSLPELAQDLKTQADALKGIWQLSPNQVLEQLGYDRSTDPNMDKIYVPSGYATLEDVAAPLGGALPELD